MKEFITSDWHFGHKNICGKDGFCPITRGQFKDVEEMNQTLTDHINKVVTNEDILYHLGDISLKNKNKDIFDTLTRINGQLVLVKGNHDASRTFNYLNKHNYNLPNGKPKFVTYDVGLIIKRSKRVYYLTHYPLGLGEQRVNMRNLCGHIHQLVPRESNILNVGVDSPQLPKDLPFGQPLELDKAMAIVDTNWELWSLTHQKNTKD